MSRSRSTSPSTSTPSPPSASRSNSGGADADTGTATATGARKAKAARVQQPDIASLETELSESLGAKVAIAHGARGNGKLVIHYSDLDTLDGVLERLRPRQQ